MYKTDETLGMNVHDHLVSLGIETPTTALLSKSNDFKKRRIEKAFQTVMETLGLDMNDDSLIETPHRIAKMLVDETMWGLDYKMFPKCTTVENKMKYDEMVLEKDIRVQSNCEHHFQPIVGKAHVAYIPKSRVLGLSKIPRIVEFFARRPQIQERLTEQVYHTLTYILGTENVAVTIHAEHLCVSQRGVRDTGASTITTRLGGVFKDKPIVRMEFFNHFK